MIRTVVLAAVCLACSTSLAAGPASQPAANPKLAAMPRHSWLQIGPQPVEFGGQQDPIASALEDALPVGEPAVFAIGRAHLPAIEVELGGMTVSARR